MPELVATGPGQVYAWDITKLAGPVKGIYYDAYMMIGIYPRYIVGVRVHPHESELLAEQMMRQVFDLVPYRTPTTRQAPPGRLVQRSGYGRLVSAS